MVFIDFAFGELAFPLFVAYRGLDLASSQVGSALSELNLLLSEEDIGTDSIPLILGIGLHVLIAILTLDRGLHLDRRSIGKPLAAIISIFHLRFIHLLANSLIFLVKFPQLLRKIVKIQRVNLLLTGLQLCCQVQPLQFGLVDLLHNVLVRLLPCSLFLADVELIAAY